MPHQKMRVLMLSYAFLIVPFFSNLSIFGIDLTFVAGQSCLRDQRDLLFEFRNNLTYDSSFSTKLVTWNESIDCCRWGGVECESRGHVTGLDLIPQFLFGLHDLSILTLSWNRFDGYLDLSSFEKMTEMFDLDLSHSNLSIHVNENFFISSALPRLNSLMLASCKLQKVPLLRNHSSLKMLDLSDNQLKGEIPNWIWEIAEVSLRFLNLSHNQFTSLQEPFHITFLDYVDLHSNMLGGQIPLPPTSAAYFDLSDNNFSSSLPANIGDLLPRARFFSIANNKIIGKIPPSLCNASFLEILDLLNNSLQGRIPSCLVVDALSVLNLRRNNLTGDIPDTFPLSCTLQTLDLSRNVFQRYIPKSLRSCQGIEVLNLAHNNLNDDFPCWFKNFTRLRVLVLSSNKFYGNISCLGEDDSSWTNLQIVSLASNSFNGFLPSNLFSNLKAMAVEGSPQSQLDFLHFVSPSISDVYYQDSVTVTLKGREYEPVKVLTIFTSVDLSNNHFEGVIPPTLGELRSLYILNLSHNALSGQIPASLGHLQKLESLDLSVNSFRGEIPRQVAGLTFLSFLNLSYNQLFGRIPTGNQMQTFTLSSFLGNEGLCGFQINKTCSDLTAPTAPHPELEEKQGMSEDLEIVISVALGFVVGVGVIFLPLLLSERWRKFYNKHVEKFLLSVLHGKDVKLDYKHDLSQTPGSEEESSTIRSDKKLIN